MDLYFQKVHQIPRVNSISIINEVKAKVHKDKSSNKIKDERFLSLNVSNSPFFWSDFVIHIVKSVLFIAKQIPNSN